MNNAYRTRMWDAFVDHCYVNNLNVDDEDFDTWLENRYMDRMEA